MGPPHSAARYSPPVLPQYHHHQPQHNSYKSFIHFQSQARNFESKKLVGSHSNSAVIPLRDLC
ncbi:hypothetical protein ACOSQ3_001275 [Xanthoceras sorbifolium]